ncbi:MAG TPA: SPOR domain-containing protein [Acetobacteraceae bacterium]
MSDDISIPTTPTYRVPLHPRRHHDPARRMRMMIAGGLAAVGIGWFGAWAMFGGGPHRVPVVQAAAGPERVKPANPGGLQVNGADNAIFAGNGSGTEDKLAPPPQTPDLQALRAPPPPPPKPAEPPRLAAAPPPATAVDRSAYPPRPPVVAEAPKPAPAVADRKPPIVAATADHHPTPQVAHAAHGAAVQLAALTSEQAARAEWDLLARRMPSVLAGKQPAISKIEHDGHTWWRLRTSGFSDTADATLFCMRLRAKGAACSVADF